MAVAVVVVYTGKVPDVTVTVAGGTEGSTTWIKDVDVPLTVVPTVVVKACKVPEVTVTVESGTEG